ncbi:unnamed protein product [Hymenolepis diminuta]|uniref:Tubulin--tyrosine ligase-like protein 9 n=1 Tax=Hymenolepis diminuta TaxID=6216 RepID=A0A3P7A891_HYMDI|nr:unnamed protein product [Hymenolepis diminuta]
MDVLKKRGWQELDPEDDNFDFFWCNIEWMRDNFDRMFLSDHVRLCHFRNHYELTRKNLMVKNLKRAKKEVEKKSGSKLSSEFDFFPTTFELPMEYHMFLEEFKKNPGFIWIMKPVAKSQGKGIFLFRKLKDIEAWKKSSPFHTTSKVRKKNTNSNFKTENSSDGDPNEGPEHYVVSRYIENPYLIGGRKFDLRVYVLVVSFQPLKVWIYRDGFARLSNVGFSMDSIDDQYVHLTNVAIQKTAPDYDATMGCKWSICRLRRYMIAKHGHERVKQLFRDIDKIFLMSLLSVQNVMISDKHCFELYGYDILVDDNLKPWLLEINASPSLTASSPEDYNLKVCFYPLKCDFTMMFFSLLSHFTF